jgi:PucR family transcriptional regulator, purine catabolism regulatory protein
MSVTVAHVLGLELLHQAAAEVVAGASQLSRPVRWVHISEQPDIARYLKGGELLLTTGMGLGMNEALQAKYLAELDEAGIAALAIRLGGTWKVAPPRLVEEARRRELPLIVLHRRIGFIELTEQIHGAIINRQLELLRKAETIGKSFTELVTRGADLSQILHQLARIVRNPVVLEDPAHQLVDFAVFDAPTEEVLATWEARSRGPLDEGAGRNTALEQVSQAGLWADIQLRDERWGRLHVLPVDGRLDEIDELALDRAVAAVALCLLNEEERTRLTDRARASLIADILGDSYGGAKGFYRRAGSCRAAFQDRTLLTLVLEPQGLASFLEAEDRSETDRRRMRQVFVQETQRAIEASGAVAVSGLDGDAVLAIVGIERGRDMRTAADEIGAAVCERAAGLVEDVVPVVGFSNEASPRSLRRALEQAAEAAAFGRGRTTPRVVHFADLGLQHLLLRLSEGPELARFVEGELSLLLDYDARRKTQLVITLRAYLDCGGQKSRAAKVLSIERRSLYHRLKRIAEVLKADLDDEEMQLRLRLALRGLDLLRQRSPVGLSRQLLMNPGRSFTSA